MPERGRSISVIRRMTGWAPTAGPPGGEEPVSTTEMAAQPRARWWARVLDVVGSSSYFVYFTFALLFVVFAVALAGDGFLTPFNLTSILRQAAPLSVMAIAFVFVLSAGEIDLSI